MYDYQEIEDTITKILAPTTTGDYAKEIAFYICKDVINDLKDCTDEDYNDDDIRFAIGRVILKSIENTFMVHSGCNYAPI